MSVRIFFRSSKAPQIKNIPYRFYTFLILLLDPMPFHSFKENGITTLIVPLLFFLQEHLEYQSNHFRLPHISQR